MYWLPALRGNQSQPVENQSHAMSRSYPKPDMINAGASRRAKKRTVRFVVLAQSDRDAAGTHLLQYKIRLQEKLAIDWPRLG